MNSQLPQPISQIMAGLQPETAQFLQLGLEGAANTVRAYRADLHCYLGWCQGQQRTAFPASPAQLADYISFLASRYTVATIQRRLAMLSSFHSLQGLESPTSHKIVRTTLEGIKRSLGIRPRMAPAFDLSTFRKVILSLDESSLKDFRDKALLLLGFTGAFRRAELTALNTEDLRFDEAGILVTVAKSKTDQYGTGAVKAIFYAAHPELCPVRTLQRYLQCLEREKGYLFPRMRKGNKLAQQRLSDQGVWRIVKRHFGAQYSAHTLRASFVTIAKKHGASNSEIMSQTFHKTESMIRRYTRFEDVREHNAAIKLGL